jgi:uncharacterized protein involved in exopolysaccharide biosynthesis
MIRQIRTGRIFLILLICDSIIASFHPLVQDEVVNWFVEMDLSGSCCFILRRSWLAIPLTCLVAFFSMALFVMAPVEYSTGATIHTSRTSVSLNSEQVDY